MALLIDQILLTLDQTTLDLLLTHLNNGSFGFVRYNNKHLLGVNIPDNGRYEIVESENNWSIFKEKK